MIQYYYNYFTLLSDNYNIITHSHSLWNTITNIFTNKQLYTSTQTKYKLIQII